MIYEIVRTVKDWLMESYVVVVERDNISHVQYAVVGDDGTLDVEKYKTDEVLVTDNPIIITHNVYDKKSMSADDYKDLKTIIMQVLANEGDNRRMTTSDACVAGYEQLPISTERIEYLRHRYEGLDMDIYPEVGYDNMYQVSYRVLEYINDLR
jgi:hypothetical protein